MPNTNQPQFEIAFKNDFDANHVSLAEIMILEHWLDEILIELSMYSENSVTELNPVFGKGKQI